LQILIHNFGNAVTDFPLGIAFFLSYRIVVDAGDAGEASCDRWPRWAVR